MRTWVHLLVLTSVFLLTSAAPHQVHRFELSMLNKLHQPLFRPDRSNPPEFPRKGEYPCESGICSNKKEACEECQGTKPLDSDGFEPL